MTKFLIMPMLAALAIAGCAGDADRTGEADQAASTGQTCANPTAYGAILNDGLDDTPAIQGAICAAMCPQLPAGCGPCSNPALPGYGSQAVCLPGGELDVTRPAGNQSFRLNAIHGLTVYGEGPGSILAMHGSGAGTCSNSCSGTGCAFADWNVFRIDGGATRIELRDFTMTSTGVSGLDKDSTRFVLFGDETTSSDELLIKNMRLADSCGDHVYILGGASNTGSTSTGVRVVDSTLLRAARRSIVIKHGTGRIEIAHNAFETNGGAVDFDPAGSDTSVAGVVIADNAFRTTSAASIVLAGDSGANHPAAGNIVVTGNLLFGPAIVGGGLRNVSIDHNTILDTEPLGEIDLVGIADHLEIAHNTIVHGSTTNVSAIRVAAKELTAPEVRIVGNSIIQASQSPAIDVEDIVHQTVSDNTIAMTWTDAAHPAVAGIKSGTDHFDVDSCQLSGNQITGSALTAGLLISMTSTVCGITFPPTACSVTNDPLCPTGTFCDVSALACRCDTITQMHVGSVVADRNLVVGATKGIQFGLGRTSHNVPKGLLRDFPLIADNDFGGAATPAVDITGAACGTSPGCLAPAYLIGGNRGGPVQLVGDGDPTTNAISVPNGSIYQQRSGTGSAALYVRENNVWVAQ